MRKQTPERAKALEYADRFAGLPPQCTRWTLCDDIETARVPLGLDSDAIWLFRFLIRRTSDLDWTRGHEPIVAWSRFEIMAVTSWSEDKLARVENRLCDSGLIAFRDAANCKRSAFRRPDGAMPADATGLSLAPAGMRAVEIQAAAYEHKEKITRLYRQFSEAFRLRAEIGQFRAIENAPAALKDKIEAIYRSLPNRRDHTAELGVLEGLVKAASEALEAVKTFLGFSYASRTQKPRAAGGDAPTASTAAVARAETVAASDRGKVSVAASMGETALPSTAAVRSLHRTNAAQKEPESNTREFNHQILGILSASPEIFRFYLEHQRASNLTVHRVIELAADRYASDLSVTPSVVGRLRRSYGLAPALEALFGLGRMLERGREIKNPAGYVLAIAARGSSGPTPRMYRLIAGKVPDFL